MKLVHIGYGNYAAAERIVAVVLPDSAPVRRSVAQARKAGTLVDATAGHRTRSVLFVDTGQVILSANQPETVAARFNQGGPAEGRLPPEEDLP
ncbi:MAG TPA: extracellular matrix/biofilm biosynthesis regulator RemA family protein [Candidatus Nitrosotenuis sp.]|jgi:regulator of extracellular matrix RemA (YlzA/DUF370 family)|nr:extracellular matrix/biofilm biosynthesis regulator RemA family protein [Candidatus Nitrosotenuis sp.]